VDHLREILSGEKANNPAPTTGKPPTQPSIEDLVFAVIDTEPRNSSAIAALTGIGVYNLDVALSTLFLRSKIQKKCVDEINYYFVAGEVPAIPAVNQNDGMEASQWLN
jgi:hypothetical protein